MLIVLINDHILIFYEGERISVSSYNISRKFHSDNTISIYTICMTIKFKQTKNGNIQNRYAISKKLLATYQAFNQPITNSLTLLLIRA